MAYRNKYMLKNIVVMIVIAVAVLFAASASTYAASPSATGNVNASSGAYLRKTASTSGAKVMLLKDNTKLTITKEVFTSKTSTAASSKWLYVTANGKTGYIRSDLVDGIKYTAVTGKTTESLNYRVGAGSSMALKGTFPKNKVITVYMTAKPYGSNTLWYKTKVGTSYRYVCSSWVTLSATIFNDPGKDNPTPQPDPVKPTDPDKPAPTEPSQPSQPSEPGAPMSDAEFEQYLTNQGFPEDYKVKLRALHKQYPNWVFIAKKTNIDWNTAVTKENANGVSLVESVWPLAWRSTDANSFKPGGSKTMYTSAGGSTSAGTIANKETFTILDEVWKGTTLWTHVKTAAGKTGYVSGTLTSQTYPSTITGKTTNDYVNIRKGAGTSNSVIKSLAPNTTVSIVLQAKDSGGTVWYKIKNGTGYAYICGSYVSVASTASTTVTEKTVTFSDKYPVATASAAAEYRAYPDMLFAKSGTVAKDEKVALIGTLKDASGKSWVKIEKNGKAYYAAAESFTYEGDATELAVPANIKGTTTEALNYRSGAGTAASKLGTFASGTGITVIGAVKSGSDLWYKISYSGKTVYAISTYVTLTAETAPADSIPKVTEEKKTTQVEAKPANLTGSGYFYSGTYIPKDGSTWFNASKQTVAYYMDPRNFLNADRVYMFEDLSYHGEYQTEAVVNKILAGTALQSNGFLASWFTEAGKKYGMSPVALAARARQETGGGSIAISGYTYNGRIVYNPFNIGATSSSNPVMNGLAYAYNAGWFTKKDAINGGASFIAGGYINRGQNSLYYQRFNVANGVNSVATHQYMTNLLAPYSEAYSVKTTYASYGITNESLTFVIPIYNNMPASTSLPN